MVNEENWIYLYYQSKSFKASLSLGGEPEGDSVSYVYFLNLHKDEELIFQDIYSSEGQAIEELNKRYSHWELGDLRKTKGCG